MWHCIHEVMHELLGWQGVHCMSAYSYSMCERAIGFELSLAIVVVACMRPALGRRELTTRTPDTDSTYAFSMRLTSLCYAVPSLFGASRYSAMRRIVSPHRALGDHSAKQGERGRLNHGSQIFHISNNTTLRNTSTLCTTER